MGTREVEGLQSGAGGGGQAESSDDTLKISTAARSERLERRVAGLERQLALRIEHQEELERVVAHLRQQVAVLSGGAPPRDDRPLRELEVELASTRTQLAESQAELAALLNTKTMRLARQPRRLYADLRANPTARSLLSRIRR